MRQIVLDTETTGLNAALGDRVIEIGAVELVNRRLTGNHFHRYVNPEREVAEGALRVHGLTDEFLSDKPLFAEVAREFIDFIRGAELIIHNASFDVEFLDAEFARLSVDALSVICPSVFDTLRFARELHPGKRNSLDALCERYGIDNAHRTLHGALLDAELLAEVYLGMTRGQDSLAIDLGEGADSARGVPRRSLAELTMRVIRATDDEAALHVAVLEGIRKDSKGRCVWLEDDAA